MSNVEKIYVRRGTTMSLHERFTALRQNSFGIVQNIKFNNSKLQQASAKNRRLAQQMENRPAVMAALKLKKRSLKQRLGPMRTNIKSRLNFNGRDMVSRPFSRPAKSVRARLGTLNARGRVSTARRNYGSPHLQRLRGSFRVDSIRRGAPNRSRGRAAVSARGIRGRFSREDKLEMLRLRRAKSERGRGSPRRGISRRGMSSRGVRRAGRGRGRGRGGGATREQLDSQLDEYMAKTKSHLDAELDAYMNEPKGEY